MIYIIDKNIFKWLNEKHDKKRQIQIDKIFSSNNNYKLIFTLLDSKTLSNESEFILNAKYLIKKIQSYIGFQKLTIIFESTLTKIFDYYIKLVKRSLLKDFDNARELLVRYCKIIRVLRPIVIPSSKFNYFFINWIIEKDLNKIKETANQSEDEKLELKRYYYEKTDDLYKYLISKKDVLDIDLNYLMYQNLCYYEMSRYSCFLILGLLDIRYNNFLKKEEYFSNKSFTIRIIKTAFNKYKNKIVQPINTYFQFLMRINKEIRNYVAHRGFEFESENTKLINSRIMDNNKEFHTNQLLLLSSILYTILKLFECWNYLFLISIKTNQNENNFTEDILLKEALYKLYSIFRPTTMNDSEYVLNDGDEFERMLFHKRFDSYIFNL